MSKSVLFIGGTGFLGSALRRAFAEFGGFSVGTAGPTGAPSDPRHLVLDLLRPETLGGVASFDIIVNLTGQVTEPMENCLALNDAGIRNVIGALHSDQRLVQVSTTQVYGTTRFADESTPVQPETPYARAKAHAEELLLRGVPADRLLLLRLCNLYGPGQTKGLPWYMLDRVRGNRHIDIADNDGSLRRHFLHVDDAAAIVRDLVIGGVAGIVNVAGPEHASIRELVTLCGRITGREIPASYGSALPRGNIDDLNTDRLRSLIPLRFRHTLEEYFRSQLDA